MNEEKLEAAILAVKEQAEKLPSHQDIDRSERKNNRKLRIWFAALCLAALVVSTTAVVVSYVNTREISANAASDALRDSSVKALDEANKTLIAQGKPPIPVPPSGTAVDANALAQAAAALVLADPRFAGLTLADLRRQVDQYFNDHPLPEGQKPTTDQVISAVTVVCSNNACKGRPPTPTEIADAVSGYCSDGSCQGKPGVDGLKGDEGPGPTRDQIDASVASYCGQSPSPCAGPPGATGQTGQTGPSGVGIDHLGQPGTRDGDCVIPVFLTNDPNNISSFFPVPMQFCESPPIISTTPSTPDDTTTGSPLPTG